MAFGKFIQRLFGQSGPLEMSPEPFAAAPAAAVREPEPEPPAPEPEAVLCREEIIDSRSRIAGYRFNARRVDSGARVEGGALVRLLEREAIDRLAQRRLALIPIGAQEWTEHDFRPFIAAETAFLLDPPPIGVRHEDWLAVLGDIRGSGAKVALTGAATTVRGALDLADLVLLDFSDCSLQAFEQAVGRIKRQYPDIKLLVANVHSWPEHRLCQARGCDCSLGSFAAAADEEDKGEKLNQSRLVLVEMLNLLRHDADSTELAEVAKRDPAVAIKVVSMANSPAAGLSSPVASVDQAIVVLGRAYLYRWLAISMFRVGGSARDEALLEVALFRARFQEILVQDRLPKQAVDEVFLVGLLSLIDILLGIPIASLVERMNLPDHVVEVLVRNEGPYGRYLMLALAIEKGRTEQIGKLASQLEVSVSSIEAARIAAQQWAAEALAFG
ncbi:MAG TPA: HDOD domain-containing protein [Rhodocyclaceae bacterium]|nr:HDOD domain-containing protein [Rhodocyclaceae bacterium]